MTRDEVIRLAREAWRDTGEGWTALQWFDARAASFQRFAALVAAAERRGDLLSLTLEAFCKKHGCSMGAASQRRAAALQHQTDQTG